MGAVAIDPERNVPGLTQKSGTLPLRREIPLLRQCDSSDCGYHMMFRQKGGKTLPRIPAKIPKMNRL